MKTKDATITRTVMKGEFTMFPRAYSDVDIARICLKWERTDGKI